MRILRHSISAVLAVALLAGPRGGALAQERWPGRDGDIQVEQLPEPPPDYRGEPPPDYRDGPGQPGPEAADPRGGEADLGEFYEQLQPHGEWIEHPRHGSVWSPYAQEQEPDWRPYTRGQWILTDEHGWYWESEEPFGWATYHYGRWFFDPAHGWLWVPGTVWGPAWVAWRESEDAIGWAPLPPDAEWVPDRGIVYRSGYYLDNPRYAAMWVFVAASVLLAPRVWRHFHPPSRSVWYFGRSRVVTTYRYDNRRVFNRGIDPRFVERRIGRPVPVMPVRPVGTWRDTRFSGGNRTFVGVYRPQLAPRVDGRPAARPPLADRARTTPPGFDPRRFEQQRRFDPQRSIERDRGLPRPDGARPPWQERSRPPEVRREPSAPVQRPPEARREAVPVQRPPEARREAPPTPRPEARREPSPGFDPRFGRSPGQGPRDIGRPEERRREASPPPPRNIERAQPPPAARSNPPAEARRGPPPENRGGGGQGRGDPRKDEKKRQDGSGSGGPGGGPGGRN